MTFDIKWIDHEREPQCAPNPDYPEGLDLIIGHADEYKNCKVNLPYPARRCGLYIVECKICGLAIGATTAGRPDDPRSITVPCRISGGVQ